MNTGLLRYPMLVLFPVEYTKNNYGERLQNQTVYASASLWGALTSWQGDQAVYNGYTGVENTLLFTVRRDDRINVNCKVDYSGSRWDVDAVTLLPNNLNYMQITLKSKYKTKA